MKKIYSRGIAVMTIGALLFGPIACKDSFLEVPVTGQLTDQQVQTANGVETLLLGAYSVLNGRGNGWHSGASNWMWGSIRGGEANKGTNAGDFNSMNPVERFELNATNGEVGGKWNGSFEGVARANFAIKSAASAVGVADATKTRIIAEARFLRGHYYFDLKKNFGNVPYIDEQVDITDSKAIAIPNTTDIWSKIEDDFKFAYENLPETQGQVGRANKWAAASYLAKALLYQKKYAEAKVLFDQIIANGKTTNGKKYGLVPRFADIWTGENENHEESIFAFQAAAGTGDVNNTNQDLAMNYPYNTGPSGPGECCGFFAPSFDLIDSYRTKDDGTPYLNSEWRSNTAIRVKNDQGLQSSAAFTPDEGNLDPRLDLTIGRRYVQFLDWMPHPGFDWIRDQSYAGPYTQKKYSYRKSDKGKFQDGSSWTPGYHAINFIIIRYADVLLMAAETEIELGNVAKGIEYINLVRTRAANSSSYVMGKFTGVEGGDNKKPVLDLTQPAGKYVIANYPNSLSADDARKAVRLERKLELALEGHRFYDLVRWGVDIEELNAYLGYEAGKIPSHFGGAAYGAEDRLLPIPQRQIDLMGPGVLSQNPGF